jgi:hypothetical protein
MTIENQIEKILNTPFWPIDIETCTPYFRTQDDCDGNEMTGIEIAFSKDGDAWVKTYPSGQPNRFRVPGQGGGHSPRTRMALLILAKAIKMDEEGGDWPPDDIIDEMDGGHE